MRRIVAPEARVEWQRLDPIEIVGTMRIGGADDHIVELEGRNSLSSGGMINDGQLVSGPHFDRPQLQLKERTDADDGPSVILVSPGHDGFRGPVLLRQTRWAEDHLDCFILLGTHGHRPYVVEIRARSLIAKPIDHVSRAHAFDPSRGTRLYVSDDSRRSRRPVAEENINKKDKR